MDPLTRYLFGFERHVLCESCPGAVYFVTSMSPPHLSAWLDCDLCSRDSRTLGGWYLRW